MPTDIGYKSYIVKPNLMSFKEIEGDVPTPQGKIHVRADKEQISVLSPIDGGTLIIGDKKYKIEANKLLLVKI